MNIKKIRKTLDSLVDFEVTRISRKLYVINFQKQKEMNLSMLRFNEHHECKNFKGKVFSHEKYVSWYKKTVDKEFKYTEEINGFFLPSKALKSFYRKKFKDLSIGEQQILLAFEDIKDKDSGIIAMHNEYEAEDLIFRKQTFKHELAHSFFYFYPSYRKKVTKLIKSVDNTAVIKFLENFAYPPAYFIDETNSYLLHDIAELNLHNVDLTEYKEIIPKLKKLYQQQKSKLKIKRYSRKKKYGTGSYFVDIT